MLIYRFKENSKVREIAGIHGNAAEITNVDSCSLYEFRITAVSKYGESKPVVLVQYTGYLFVFFWIIKKFQRKTVQKTSHCKTVVRRLLKSADLDFTM